MILNDSKSYKLELSKIDKTPHVRNEVNTTIGSEKPVGVTEQVTNEVLIESTTDVVNEEVIESITKELVIKRTTSLVKDVPFVE